MITKYQFFKQIALFTVIGLSVKFGYAAVYESTPAGGYWSQSTTWVGGVVPVSTSDTVLINGNVLLDTNVQIKDIIIDTNVTFQNATFSNYNLGVDGDLINYGTIQNNFYSLYINLWGGLYQHGVLSNYQLKLYNTQHDIDASQPLTVQYFNLANGAKDINVLSDTLHFIGTQVSVLGADFYFNDGLLTLDGGFMINADIIASNLDINLVNGAYIGGTNFTGDYVGLYGTFNTLTNNFYGNTTDVVVEVVGILQNNSSSNYTMTVNGDLINNGTIQNNFYNLTLNISGDITNNGAWTNQTTNLAGVENQTITFTQPFYGTYLNNANINGYFIASTDLEFVGTSVDLNGDTLHFSNGPANLILSGGYLREYNIIGQGSPNELTIDLSSGGYLRDGSISHDEIYLVNTFQFSGSMTFKGNVTVQGSMQNTTSSNHTANINGDLTNNGLISNNFYNLSLNITGDMINNGTWENQYTNLSGAEDQSIYLNNPYDGPFLINTNSEGKILAQTSLIFNNTLFDMNLDTLVFTGYSDSLAFNGNNLREAKIIREVSKAAGTLKINLMSGAWMHDVHFFADQVDLYGVFQFSGSMQFFANLVVNHGLLQNYASANYTAEVFGNLVNNGTISNNSYNLYVNITGDITQNGSWTNNTTSLTGADDQTLFFNQPFNGLFLTNSNTAGKIVTLTNLDFNNTLFNMNSDTLAFAGAADSLSFNANNFKNAIVIRNDAKSSGSLKFNFKNNAWLSSVNIFADEIDLYGVFQFTNAMYLHGNVTNHGILRNYASSNYNSYIYGDLQNAGAITNNFYSLSVYIEGDIQQYGTWSCQNTYLIGSATQNIEQTQPFKCVSFVDSDPGSDIVLTSDFVFENTNVDLNGATVIMPVNAVLSLKGGSFREADFPTDGIEVAKTGTGGFDYVSFVSPLLRDLIQVGYDVEFSGHTRVMGTLQNIANTNHILQVNGSIENHGTIQDNFYQLQMYVQEDVLNNGTWTNSFTQLEGYSGSINQNVYLQDGNYITGQLRLFSNNSSNYLWYKDGSTLFANPDYTGATSQVLQFLVPADNIRAGVYNCNTSAGWSRNIIITTSTSDYPIVNLNVFLEGPFNGSDMNTVLNNMGSLPLTQPYGGMPNNYFGSEDVVSIPDPDIVDWLLIEFRDAVDADNATQSTRADRQAAFLLSNGQVVGMNGSSYLTVPYSFIHNMFVIVHHRNHLDVMSANALIESGGVYSYDFTYDTWNSYGGPFASKNIGTDLDPIYGMMGGDSNSDGAVDETDFAFWSQTVGTLVNYEGFDNNLDGQIDNQDKNDTWVENLGNDSQVPE